jgi:phosphohistidine phosphatase
LRTLYLLRHAKSSWDEAGSLTDHDRPLARRGRLAAVLMGAYLREEGIRPALVIGSSALRVRQTFEQLATGFGDSLPVTFERRLYLASTPRLLNRVREIEDAAPSAMLIGHDPGHPRLAQSLAGAAGSDAGALKRLTAKFPTAALAVLTFDAAERWSEVAPGTGRLVSFVAPKDLI